MGNQQAEIATNILIPIDGSDPSNRAIDFAAEIGGPNAAYRLLHVTPDESLVRNATRPDAESTLAEVHATAALLAGQERLQSAVSEAKQETVLRTGDPARAIVKEA